MRTTHWPMAAILGLLLTGCAGAVTVPTPEARHALAPTGKLRVGLYLSPVQVIKDPASGEMKGVGFDLGKEFARRMGIPFEPVVYPSIGALVDNARTGQWDIAFLAILSERTKDVDFTAPALEIELGYLVLGGSPISTLAAVDRPGVRVAVVEKGAVDVVLSRELKNATLVRGAGLAGGLEILKSAKADVIAASKAYLFPISDQLPGSRVLEGRFATERVAMALPKGRDLAIPYADKFVEVAKSEGLVKAAVQRAGLRGTADARSQ
jgi:polar amino acid transport system substrate-binding protein